MDREPFRDFLRGSGFGFIGTFADKIFRYLFLFVATRLLTASTFGAFVFLLSIINLVQRMGMFGINKSIDYYVPQFLSDGDERAARSVLLTATVMLLGIGSVLGAMISFAADPLAAVLNRPALGTEIALISVAIPLYMYQTTVRDCFHAVKKIGLRVAVENVFDPIVRIVLLVALVSMMGYGLLGAVGSFVAATGVVAVVSTVVFVRSNRWVLNPDVRFFNIKELLKYSLPLSGAVVTAAIIGQMDIIILGFYADNAAVGYYRLAYSVAMLLGMFPPVFSPIIKPFVAENTGNSERIQWIFQQTTRWVVLVTAPLAITLFSAPVAVVQFLFGAEYTGAPAVPAVIMTGKLFVISLGLQSRFLQGLGTTGPVFWSKVAILVVNLVLDLLLIPRIGPLGAAIGATAGMIAGSIVQFVAIRNRYSIKLTDKAYVKTLGLVVVVYIGVRLVPVDFSGVFLLLLGAAVSVVYWGLALITGAIAEDDLVIVAPIEEKIGVELTVLKRAIRYQPQLLQKR